MVALFPLFFSYHSKISYYYDLLSHRRPFLRRKVFLSSLTLFRPSDSSPPCPKKAFVSKKEDVLAVVMIGSRQYIVFPGRYICTQRLKGANENDKRFLNKDAAEHYLSVKS